jgi:hypothetical protein
MPAVVNFVPKQIATFDQLAISGAHESSGMVGQSTLERHGSTMNIAVWLGRT